jgi:hypothetical protein|tara:strand:- start:366 stop:593 length:228 start_codon:yes stop_codon:yes gene_type:complete
MKVEHLPNQSKTKFEELLFDLNGREPIGYQKHHDVDYEKNTHQIVHLYYNDHKHIGSWTKGKCWIYPDHIGNEEA